MENVLYVHVDCVWDEEAGVWTATSPDVKGLVLEDSSFDRLMYRVELAVPELLQLNDNSRKTAGYLYQAEKRQAVYA